MNTKKLFLGIALSFFVAFALWAQSEPTGGTFSVSSGTNAYKLQFGWERYFIDSIREQGLSVGKFNSDGWIFTINSKEYNSQIKESDYDYIEAYEEAYYSFVSSLSNKLENARQNLKSLNPPATVQNESELQAWVKSNTSTIEAELSRCGITYNINYYYIKRISSQSENDYWIAGKNAKGSGRTETPMM